MFSVSSVVVKAHKSRLLCLWSLCALFAGSMFYRTAEAMYVQTPRAAAAAARRDGITD